MATEDPFANVRALETAVRLADDQPSIEGSSSMIRVEVTSTDYMDERAYASERFDYMSEEIQLIQLLERNLAAGEGVLSLIYSYRGVSRAIPQTTQDQTNKLEVSEKRYEVLRPEILKMRQLMAFQEKSVATIVDVVKRLSGEKKKEKPFVSEELLLAFARNFSMYTVLDAAKNMKSSMTNDFAIYKRDLATMKKATMSGEDETMENQKLNMFLANRDAYSMKLRSEVQAVHGEELLIDVLEKCCDLYERKIYVVPEDKYMLVRAMAFSLFLLDADGGEKDKNNILKHKRIHMDRYTKIFRSMPVVPLFGDMFAVVTNIFKTSPHLKEINWEHDKNDENLKKSYNLLPWLDQTRTEYREYVAAYGAMVNEHRKAVEASDLRLSTLRYVYETLLRGLQLLGKWTAAVLAQSAWKYHYPTERYLNPECPEEATQYEKAVRFNYNNAERAALIEYLAMIKGVQRMLSGADAKFGEAIATSIHAQLQAFLTGPLTEMTAHAAKKKKPVLNLLLHMRDIAADIGSSFEGGAGGSSSGMGTLRKKDKKAMAAAAAAAAGGLGSSSSGALVDPSANEKFNIRACGTTTTQLAMFRGLLDAAYNERAPGMKGGLMKEKDFSSADVAELDKFFVDSFYFPYMLRFDETLQAATDLSELWYKEYYLELEHKIQFPIEMSLPWILTDYVLENDVPELVSCILYPLDLYNDAANRALYKVKTRYLYDEIEAEVNLAFDQFVFKLSRNIYAHYKARAGAMVLQKDYKIALEELLGTQQDGRFEAAASRYEAILRQRHVQLLGRSIDIGRLLAQRIIGYLKRSLDVAIGRFESSDITGVIELTALIQVNRVAHALLSEHLPLEPFEEMFAESDEEFSLVAYNGRIATHLISEFVNDFIPNYCYNSITDRYVRTPATHVFTEQVQRAHAPKADPINLFGAKPFNAAFAAYVELNRGFVGDLHLRAILRLLGRQYLPVLLGELCNNAKVLFDSNVNPYVSALMRGFPQSSKLPLYLYGLTGTYQYFEAILKPVREYGELKTEVFQSFRELGNTVALIASFDRTLEEMGVVDVAMTGPLLGLQAASSEGNVDTRVVVAHVLAEASELIASSSESTVAFGPLGARVAALYDPNRHTSLLSLFLENFNAVLNAVRGEWRGAEPSNDVIEVDYCIEFYRIWSALQFSYCTPEFNDNAVTTRQIFGEGLQLAGCTIMHLLEQEHRFNVLDFTYHMMNVATADDKPPETVRGVDLGKFIDLGAFYKTVNDDMFRMLRHHYPIKKDKVGVFHPPTSDGPEGEPTYTAYPGEHGTAKRVVTEKKLTGVAE